MKRYRVLHVPTGKYVQVDITIECWRLWLIAQWGKTTANKYSILDYFKEATFGLQGLWLEGDSYRDGRLHLRELENLSQFNSLFRFARETRVNFYYCIAFDLGLCKDITDWHGTEHKKYPFTRHEFEVVEVDVPENSLEDNDE